MFTKKNGKIHIFVIVSYVLSLLQLAIINIKYKTNKN